MNDIFKPSLVISVGPSANKALSFLNNMLLDLPKYLRDLIEFYNVNNIDDIKEDVQNIIDEKLLSAKSVNKLVDLGYKIRSENNNIKIGVYLYWDVYGSDFNINDLINILFSLNYCIIDKDKNLGVELFIMPMLDKEWLYDKNENIKKIEDLRKLIDFIKTQDNMINMDSKVYLTHCIANDGLRVTKVELEYIMAIVTYLTILPSEEPVLSSYNKRLLMSEGDYKVGTIGISTLTIFKDKVREEFSSYLINDIVKHGVKYNEYKEFNIYDSCNNLNSNFVLNNLGKEVPNNNERLQIPDRYRLKLENEKIYNRDAYNYPERIDRYEENLKNKYIKGLKDNIDRKKEALYKRGIEDLENDLNSIIANYSLKCGKSFLEEMLEKINKESVNYVYEDTEGTINYREELKQRVNSYPSFIGYFFRVALIMVFTFYSIIEIMGHINFITFPVNLIIIFLAVFSLAFFSIIEYLMIDKKFIKFIKKCIDDIAYNEEKLLRKYLGKEIYNYYDFMKEVIENKIQEVDRYIDNLSKIKVDTNSFKNRKEDEVEILVTDLFNYEDRKKFYEVNKDDIWPIYCSFIKELDSIDELKYFKVKEKLDKFSKVITERYVNIDFYQYAKIKWGSTLYDEVSCWMDKGLIKSKDLLQYSKDYDLEEHKIFIGSGDFINDTREIITNKLSRYKAVSIKGKDIYTNCISIINLTLGINLDKVSPFSNLERGNKE